MKLRRFILAKSNFNGKLTFKSLSFIFVGKLRSFKAIHANNVAKAIMHITKNQLNDLFFTSDKLEDLSRIN